MKKRPPRYEPDPCQSVRAVYAELDARPLERNCTLNTECCQFKITGRTPFLTKGEAVLAARALRAAGRTKMPVREDGACPMLHPHTHRCLIYKDRPFACRTHFCAAAGGPADRADVLDLIRKLEAIDAELSGWGARQLPVAIAAEL